ncbi:MAG: hypothetical protein V3V20_05495 [Algisphaera sp.]
MKSQSPLHSSPWRGKTFWAFALTSIALLTGALFTPHTMSYALGPHALRRQLHQAKQHQAQQRHALAQTGASTEAITEYRAHSNNPIKAMTLEFRTTARWRSTCLAMGFMLLACLALLFKCKPHTPRHSREG